MEQYALHLCGIKNDLDECLIKMLRLGMGVSGVSFLELEPGDDSTDPGGLVSLAQLGYKRLDGPMSLDEALQQPLPDRPFCLAMYFTKSEYQDRINLNFQKNNINLAVDSLGCVRGKHELQGVVHLIREEAGEWRIDSDGRYRVVKAECSIEISGEGEGDRLELIRRVLMHPHTQQALRILRPEQVADLSIVF